MENTPSSSKINSSAFDDDVFDDSSFVAKFQDSNFKQNESHNASDSINNTKFNVSALCCDEEISGYDKLAGRNWIYPTNYPVRNYQFNIINAALVKNTLVSLPTGLGKTFIAAVIMYNFYRWYPMGKIIFTAPTRPLVAQQIDACYNIIAIPPDDTIEMTGHMQINTRKTHWKTKRVFFATPQVIYNDIQSGICPADKIRCLVIDEAHRARGNYSYCQIVSTLTDMGHKVYRLLALSATPGSKVEDVANVVRNLHIAHLELRTESCIDVAPYRHSRKINTVVIQLGPQLTQLRNQYVEILDGYARRLKQLNILPNNLGNLSKGRVVMLYKEFQTRDRTARHPQHNFIMKDFTILIALYHGLELLVKHGSRVFLNFFDEHPEKSWIQADDRLTALLERLRDDLGINPLSLDRSILPDGTLPEMPKNLVYGHPKFDKLKEIMLQHFQQSQEKKQDTRAIVFCEYRESVNLVHCLLLQCRPLIKAQMFVGQGASGKDGKTVVSQKQQLRVMKNFREGASNVLVATCVAEEGLDVGSVDLIVCFDISNRSPIRLVQRCGRTGRERGGNVQILVTEGREHQTLMDCIRQSEGLNKKILQSKEVQNNLYKFNPRMMPHDFTPTCQKMYITVAKKQDKNDTAPKNKKGQKDLRTMLLGAKTSSSSSSNSSLPESGTNLHITKEEFDEMFPKGYQPTSLLPIAKEYWAMKKEMFQNSIQSNDDCPSRLSIWLEWQRTLQKTVNVGHSRDSSILSELLQYSDNKRFDMPTNTQNPSFCTQEITVAPRIAPVIVEPHVEQKVGKKKQKTTSAKSPIKKDGDIRALFSTATKSTKNYTKLIKDLGVPNDGTIPTSLIDLFVDLSIETTNITKPCYICLNICKCEVFKSLNNIKKTSPVSFIFLNNLLLPDLTLIDDIDKKGLLEFNKSKNNETRDNIKDIIRIGPNFDLEFDFDLEDAKVEYDKEVSENRVNVVENFDLGDIEDIFVGSSPEEVIKEDLFDEKNVEDIFVGSSPEEVIQADLVDEKNDRNPKQALEFFGLDSIDDIFADSDNSVELVETKKQENQEISLNNFQNNRNIEEDTRASSPSLLSGSLKSKSAVSPILCTQTQKKKCTLSTKKNNVKSSTPYNIKTKLSFENDINNITKINQDLNAKSNLKLTTINKGINDVSTQSHNKSLFSITQLVEIINKTDNTTGHETSNLIKSKTDDDLLNKEIIISTSPILLTQADKKEIGFAVPDNIKTYEADPENTERCSSPILLTQTERKLCYNTKKQIKSLEIRKNHSLVILDSDSDSEGTVIYDIENDKSENIDKLDDALSFRTPLTNKRKFDDDNTNPYIKKQKTQEGISLQEKIILVLSQNRKQSPKKTDNFDISLTMSQKENLPEILMSNEKLSQVSNFLQKFRRDKKRTAACSQNTFNETKRRLEFKNNVTFDDSDDDFVSTDKGDSTELTKEKQSLVNHKVRKKNKCKRNKFVEVEAEMSGSDSGDELTDESVGSIIDFICDDQEDLTQDIHAVYLESVKSPRKGMFKIPQLPARFDKEEVFSQFVENDDAYEMDSFCVDSNVGLTQAHDMSELELAERRLEMKRKVRRKRIYQETNPNVDDSAIHNDTGSPIVKRKNKIRRISSDSDISD